MTNRGGHESGGRLNPLLVATFGYSVAKEIAERGSWTYTMKGRDRYGNPVYDVRAKLPSYQHTMRRNYTSTLRKVGSWDGKSFNEGAKIARQGSDPIPEPPDDGPQERVYNPGNVSVRTPEYPGGPTIRSEQTALERRRNDLEALILRWATDVPPNPDGRGGRHAIIDGEEMEQWLADVEAATTPEELFNLERMYLNITQNRPQFDPLYDTGTGGTGGGGGGGFGGGSVGPQYREPDRRVVEDFVKGTMVSLLGTVHDDQVDDLVEIYMKDHRRNFDSIGQEIDPSASVVEALRETDDYQNLHELRPASEDERDWVAARRRAAAQGGLQTDRQENFARVQAAVGGDIPDVREAAAVRQTTGSGTTRGTTLENKVKSVALALFQGVK